MSEGEQILIARDDDVGAAGLRGFDEAVVVGVADKLDGLRGGDHDGREGEEFDELVCITDDRLQRTSGRYCNCVPFREQPLLLGDPQHLDNCSGPMLWCI